MPKEKTLLLIKPDAHAMGAAGKIFQRLFDEGFDIVAAKDVLPTPDLVEKHYEEVFRERPNLRQSVTNFLTSGKVTAIIAEREDAVKYAREIIGPLTKNAPKGTIRGDLDGNRLYSRIHGSDSLEAAEREIEVWFGNKMSLFLVVAVGAILAYNKGDEPEALILQRPESEEEGPGLWCVPGGKMELVDWGSAQNTFSHEVYIDVLRQALSRETEEEAGIKINHADFLPLCGQDLVFLRKDGRPTFVLPFCAVLKNKCRTRTNRKGLNEGIWVSEKDLPKFNFIGSTEQIIRQAMRQVSGKK